MRKTLITHVTLSLVLAIVVSVLMPTYADAAPTLTLNQGNTIAREASKYINKVNYLAGGSTSPQNGLDNAGFIKYVFAQYNVHVSDTISGLVNAGERVATLQPGDVIFFSNGVTNQASVAAIYIGGGKFVGSSAFFGGVVEQDLNRSIYQQRFLGIRRMHQPQTQSSSTNIGQRIVAEARKYLGTPYLLGASSSTTRYFDCSSFTQRVVADAGLGTIPRTARGQAAFFPTTDRAISVRASHLRPGDLLYWTNMGNHVPPGTVSHTGIYIGNNYFIHATPGKGVAIDRLSGIYMDPYRRHSAFRIVR